MPARDPETGELIRDPETGQLAKAGTRHDRPETREEEETRADPRAGRIPLGTHKPRLWAPTRRGFVRRFINDIPGRIEQAIQGGWTHVEIEGEEGRDERRFETVGVNEDGSAMRAYLMEIPEELYKQDQEIKQRPLDEFDEQLRRGNIRGADPKDNDAFYVPTEGISVRVD